MYMIFYVNHFLNICMLQNYVCYIFIHVYTHIDVFSVKMHTKDLFLFWLKPKLIFQIMLHYVDDFFKLVKNYFFTHSLHNLYLYLNN